MFAAHVQYAHHAVLCMLLAVRACSTSVDIKERPLRAGDMCATLVSDVYHAVLRMYFAVHPNRAALDIVPRCVLTGIARAPPLFWQLNHAVLSMLLAVLCPPAALGVEARRHHAEIIEATFRANVHHAL